MTNEQFQATMEDRYKARMARVQGGRTNSRPVAKKVASPTTTSAPAVKPSAAAQVRKPMPFKTFETEADYNTHVALIRAEVVHHTPAEQHLRQRVASERTSEKLRDHIAKAKTEGRNISGAQAATELKRAGDPDFQG